uniref:Uncharacterized protein n=1 Tax=Glossina pallidipes TaxID=7398 RepID=A0A1A9Z6D4_GLOPL
MEEEDYWESFEISENENDNEMPFEVDNQNASCTLESLLQQQRENLKRERCKLLTGTLKAESKVKNTSRLPSPKACLTTHAERIVRHNAAQDKMVLAARRNSWGVSIERHIRGRGGRLLKPDLILTKGDRVIVCDIGIHWEGQERGTTHSQPPLGLGLGRWRI